MKKLMLILILFSRLILFGQQDLLDCSSIGIIENDTIICKGDSIQLSAPLGYNYLWSTGDTGSTILLSPFETINISLEISNFQTIDTIGFNESCNTSEFLLGDVNNDQLINVQDIVLIVDWILEGEYNPCGDVNCDQILTDDDVYLIQDYILGFNDILGCINCTDDITITVETCGCLDPLACNYCSLCTMDNNSCWYANDCNGVSAKEDELTLLFLKHIDLLGREGANDNFNIKIFNNGIVRKEYLLR